MYSSRNKVRRHIGRYRGPISSEDFNMMQLEAISSISDIKNEIDNMSYLIETQDADTTTWNIYNNGSVIYSDTRQAMSDTANELSYMTNVFRSQYVWRI